jgi:chemotaxis response regulator CheB
MPQLDIPADVLFAEAQAARSVDGERMLTISGRYSFKNWYGSDGKVREFSCRLTGITPHEMALIVPVMGRKGADVTVECEEFGQLEGTVDRATSLGFSMQIKATEEERQKLADKIAWHEKFQKKETVDNRKHKRIVPANPLSSLMLADGSRLRCFVIDMSISGVAVSADIMPELRMPLAVGKVVGRVVRHMPGGFAIEFVEKQEMPSLERLIIQPTP